MDDDYYESRSNPGKSVIICIIIILIIIIIIYICWIGYNNSCNTNSCNTFKSKNSPKQSKKNSSKRSKKNSPKQSKQNQFRKRPFSTSQVIINSNPNHFRKKNNRLNNFQSNTITCQNGYDPTSCTCSSGTLTPSWKSSISNTNLYLSGTSPSSTSNSVEYPGCPYGVGAYISNAQNYSCVPNLPFNTLTCPSGNIIACGDGNNPSSCYCSVNGTSTGIPPSQSMNSKIAKSNQYGNAITTNTTIGYPGCPGGVAENSSNSNGSYECLSAAANVFTCK